MDHKFWHLRNHKLFKSLKNSEIDDLCIIMRFKEGKKGDLIFFDDQDEPRVYLLKKGRIKIVDSNENGDEIIKDIIVQGELFGELSMAGGSEEVTEYARVLTPSVTICSFRVQEFQTLMGKHPDLALHYTTFIGLRLKRLQNRYSNLFFKDVKMRLIDFFQELIKSEGVAKEGCTVIQNYLTHQDIAGLICTTRQTVNQLINDMERDGWLKYDRKEIAFYPAFNSKK